ncbi:MAG: hypothetical protein KC731_34085, partial [Myxococcales bacterium]|nr:hypothetical protein [Myxococcales bacterium]
MSTGEVVLLICVGLWLLRGVQLLRMRMPLVRAWRSYLQVVVAIGASGASWWWWPAAAPGVGVGLVVVLLILPAAFTREAARALRFGHRRLALTHAWLAFAARPVAAQRRLITSLEQSWRLRQAQAVDIDAAVASLGPLPPAEAQAHRLVFTSWTNDFERMAELLA